MIEKFLNSKIKKFVFTSSIAAIGLVRTKTGLVDENVQCNLTTFYGKSKREAEKLLFSYFEESSFPAIILRLLTIYGPSGKNGFLDTVGFIKRKIDGRRPIFYVGRGDGLTSLCYVENVIDALILAMRSKYSGEVFRIDGGRPYTSREVLNTISDVLGKRPAEIYVPKAILSIMAYTSELIDQSLGFRLGDLLKQKLETLSTSLAFNISKTRKCLSFNPKHDFETFVRKTVDWYRKAVYSRYFFIVRSASFKSFLMLMLVYSSQIGNIFTL